MISEGVLLAMIGGTAGGLGWGILKLLTHYSARRHVAV
jgi:hypothetical protein